MRTTIIVAAATVVLAVASMPTPAKMHIIGSYPIPDGGRAASAIDLPGTRVALRTFGIASNYYEFDCSSLQFVNPHHFDNPASDKDSIGWVCWAGSGANLGIEFSHGGQIGIGSRTAGQLLYSFAIDTDMPYEVPYLYAGTADGVEVMVVIQEHHGKAHFLNLSQPGFLGTVVWPAEYATPRRLIFDMRGDYMSWHGTPSYCYNSRAQTLFVPITHHGLVYWCQIRLSAGYWLYHSAGSIDCGTRPQYIIQSTDGSAVYVFDDGSNEVFTINPLTKQITNSAQFESNSVLGMTIYDQGYLFFPLDILPSRQHVQRLVRLDPGTGHTISATLNGWSIKDLDAYGNSIYALQHDLEDNCHLLEFRASDLQLLDDIIVGDDETLRMQVDAPSGRLTVWDETNESLVVVQL